MPLGGADRGYYEAARPDLKVPASGTGAALPLNGVLRHPPGGGAAALAVPGRQAGDCARGGPRRGQPQPLRRPGIHGAWDSRRSHHVHRLAGPAFCQCPKSPRRDRHAVAVGGQHPGDVAARRYRRRQPVRRRPIQHQQRALAMARCPAIWRCVTSTAATTPGCTPTGLQALDAMDTIELNTAGAYTPANGAVYPQIELRRRPQGGGGNGEVRSRAAGRRPRSRWLGHPQRPGRWLGRAVCRADRKSGRRARRPLHRSRRGGRLELHPAPHRRCSERVRDDVWCRTPTAAPITATAM